AESGPPHADAPQEDQYRANKEVKEAEGGLIGEELHAQIQGDEPQEESDQPAAEQPQLRERVGPVLTDQIAELARGAAKNCRDLRPHHVAALPGSGLTGSPRRKPAETARRGLPQTSWSITLGGSPR